MQIMYYVSDNWQIVDKFTFDMIVLFTLGFNAMISNFCVLLKFSICTKLYRFLCCCCSVCCTHCFMYCSIRKIMINVEDKLAKELSQECEMELSANIDYRLRQHRLHLSSHSTISNTINKQRNSNLNSLNITLNSTGKNVNHLASINSNSVQSTSTTPTNKMQFVGNYFDDEEILEEQEEQFTPKSTTNMKQKKSISQKIMNITITSPDNKDIVVMENKMSKPSSPHALNKKYGLDLNFNRTTPFKNLQSDTDNDTDNESDDGLGQDTPSTKKQTKYADGSVAAILATIEQGEAEMSECEDEVGGLANFRNDRSTSMTKSKKRMSLSTQL